MMMMALALLIVAPPVAAQLTAADIIDRADALASTPQATMRYEQVVITERGVRTEYVVEAFSKSGDEKQLTRYLEPAKVRGTSFLMLDHGDSIWAYFSSTGRVRLLATHMKKQQMMGSEFTYEDMAMTSLKRNYTAVLDGEERMQRRPSYRLQLAPMKDSAYAKLTAWVDQETFVVLQVDYHRPGESVPFKTMAQGDVRTVDGRPTPHLIVMRNHQTGAQTAIRLLEVNYSRPLDDGLFTTAGMQKAGAGR